MLDALSRGLDRAPFLCITEQRAGFMNLNKLKQAEAAFFASFPQGFEDPGIRFIRKKHNMTRLVAQVQDGFAKARFKQSGAVVDDMVRAPGAIMLGELNESVM